MNLRRSRPDPEIDPDEIFLDASNTPDFDRARFEGRIEQPLSRGVFFSITAVLTILFLVLVIRTGNLQIVQGAAFAAESAHNSLESTVLFAPRGVIVDRHDVVLAQNITQPDDSIVRNYPLPALGQIIGYVSRPKKDASGNYYDTSQTGLAGLEAQYDTFLTGQNGQVLIEKDAVGQVHSQGVIVPAKQGQTLRLSLDAVVEKYLAEAISTIARDKGFIAGAGVIMDVLNGEVIAIVSYPSYDPNVMASGAPAVTIRGYTNDPGHPFLDHAVQGNYTPGSIVKPLVASGALTDGLITTNTTINDPGFLSLPDPYHPGKTFTYKGWKALGVVSVEKAIAWSSDVFFYTIGGGFQNQKGMGIDRLAYWYDQYGLGKSTGIDLPEEGVGIIPTPDWKQATFHEPWYLGDTYFTAIGQYGMQVTPVQMVRATAAIANGGRLLTPTLRLGEQTTATTVPVSSSALTAVRSGMRQSVTSALANLLNVPYVTVAAKTGTAQTGTRNQYDNSWVEGFFPYDTPRYAFAVVLERGPSGAGEQSVNVMRRFFDSLYTAHSPYVGGDGRVATTTPS